MILNKFLNPPASSKRDEVCLRASIKVSWMFCSKSRHLLIIDWLSFGVFHSIPAKGNAAGCPASDHQILAWLKWMENMSQLLLAHQLHPIACLMNHLAVDQSHKDMSPELFGLMTQLLRRPSLMPSCQLNAKCTLLVKKCKFHDSTLTLLHFNIATTKCLSTQTSARTARPARCPGISHPTHETIKWEHTKAIEGGQTCRGCPTNKALIWHGSKMVEDS